MSLCVAGALALGKAQVERAALQTAHFGSGTPRPPQPTEPPTPSPTSTPDADELLLAEQVILEGDPERAISTLLPLLDTLSQQVDRARAYDDLGQAEMLLGHSRLAAAYFDQAFDIAPNSDTLFRLALANDMGGDLERALGQYQQLVAWAGEDADPFRELAQGRIRRIFYLLGTPMVPTLLP
jgi:tetratricopeptide (TPR) repeat protein